MKEVTDINWAIQCGHVVYIIVQYTLYIIQYTLYMCAHVVYIMPLVSITTTILVHFTMLAQVAKSSLAQHVANLHSLLNISFIRSTILGSVFTTQFLIFFVPLLQNKFIHFENNHTLSFNYHPSYTSLTVHHTGRVIGRQCEVIKGSCEKDQ